MTTMQCQEFQKSGEDWLGGPPTPEAAAHLRQCPRCRAWFADIEAIHKMAPQLADDVAPPPHLWSAIRARLEEEGLIRQRGWLERLIPGFSFSLRPVLAAVYVALVAAAVLFLTSKSLVRLDRTAWQASTERSMTSLHTQLAGVEKQAVSSLHERNPAVRASFQRNLEIVDNSIALCEKTVRNDPQDEMARDYLYDAYQQKADLLANIAERGAATQ
jgi:hypothetical protein